MFCDPMPDAAAILAMYGPGYETGTDAPWSLSDPKDRAWPMAWLDRVPKGTFLDFGCGAGQLLGAAVARGWRAVGIEFDGAYSAMVAQRTGVRVEAFGSDCLEKEAPVCDVMHLGDVLEHLTALDEQMPKILRLIRPGGLLLAQGPLEGSRNLFTLALLARRRLRRGAPIEAPPYHVIFASAAGQARLFERFGLASLEYRVEEAAWPAPDRLAPRDLLRPKVVGLYATRKCSQLVTAIARRPLGNRYFYAGRVGAG
jgi:SAM-dependent methyltransferase